MSVRDENNQVRWSEEEDESNDSSDPDDEVEIGNLDARMDRVEATLDRMDHAYEATLERHRGVLSDERQMDEA